MRYFDWPTRLHQTMMDASAKPFEWGTHDCTLFAADCVRAMTGVDHMAPFRGRYSDAKSARKLIGRKGLGAAAAKVLGEPIAPAYAHRGDVVLAVFEGRETLGICIGTHAVFAATVGTGTAPMTDCSSAWRVI